MFSPCLAKRLSLFSVLAAHFIIPSQSFAAKTFRICAEPNALPMSQRSSNSGYEIDLTRMIAKDLGEKLQVIWVSQKDRSYFRETIGAGVCDAIMGVPSDFKILT